MPPPPPPAFYGARPRAVIEHGWCGAQFCRCRTNLVSNGFAEARNTNQRSTDRKSSGIAGTFSMRSIPSWLSKLAVPIAVGCG